MEIAEYIYKGVVQVDANHVGHSRKTRGESTSSNTYPNMSESAVKRRKLYVDHT